MNANYLPVALTRGGEESDRLLKIPRFASRLWSTEAIVSLNPACYADTTGIGSFTVSVRYGKGISIPASSSAAFTAATT